MKAETYFKTSIEPRINNFLAKRSSIYQKAVFEDTTHVVTDLRNITTNRAAYYYLLKSLLWYYPVIALRDDLNIDLGIYVVGKPSIVTLFNDILLSTIKAIERPLKDLRPSNRVDKRFDSIKVIVERIDALTKPEVERYTMIETRFNQLSKEYIKSISTLRIKKRFYGK